MQLDMQHVSVSVSSGQEWAVPILHIPYQYLMLLFESVSAFAVIIISNSYIYMLKTVLS